LSTFDRSGPARTAACGRPQPGRRRRAKRAALEVVKKLLTGWNRTGTGQEPDRNRTGTGQEPDGVDCDRRRAAPARAGRPRRGRAARVGARAWVDGSEIPRASRAAGHRSRSSFEGRPDPAVAAADLPLSRAAWVGGGLPRPHRGRRLRGPVHVDHQQVDAVLADVPDAEPLVEPARRVVALDVDGERAAARARFLEERSQQRGADPAPAELRGQCESARSPPSTERSPRQHGHPPQPHRPGR
jgi:hypothetical protein